MLFFFFFSFFYFNFITNADELNIISREKWWAVEEYRYLDSQEWVKILEKNKNKPVIELSQAEKEQSLKKAKKIEVANNFLINNYPSLHEISEINQYENWHKLAWPIAKSKIKSSIIIHHTDTNNSNSYDAIRSIYKYHSLTNAWWDIWYNFLIWFDWEIFEWRAGWEMSIWAHDKWNNQFSIWIWVIWNYQNEKANEKQIESINKLVKYLIEKHNIDFTQKVPYFRWCVWKTSCDENPLDIITDYTVIGHRDAWHTNCPWDELHKQLLKLRIKWLLEFKNDKNYVLKQKLLNVSEEKLINFLALIEEKIDSTNNFNTLKILNNLKLIILSIENKRIDNHLNLTWDNFEENNKIKVKLSYPFNDNLSLKIDWNYTPSLEKKSNEFILKFNNSPKYNSYSMNFKFIKDKLYLNDKEVLNFTKSDFFRIVSPDNKYLTISSWDRQPQWDKKWIYNDNKFRWDIIFYKKDDKLIVVNELLLNYYLKWLWEVSDTTNVEKIKSIIILARTYARWYMTKAEKFVWEWYHASDDPNVFQKYMWYWLEERSPKINKIVDETKDLIITYNWDLIKPWYFSSSNWYTTSFIDFCKQSKWVVDCKNPEKFPFLVWVKDLWVNSQEKNWHWVWVPWTWVQYFSEKWWNYNMIIKYFLKWVNIWKL